MASIQLAALGAMAQTTNALSDTEIHGRELAKKLYEARPTEQSSNTATMFIRDSKGIKTQLSVICGVVVTFDSWRIFYVAKQDHTNDWVENALSIAHPAKQENVYFVVNQSSTEAFSSKYLDGNQTMIPFAGSDFWICDLGLEFFHWPNQKILRGETMRGVFCKVLESTNPDPPTNGYSRVVSWIDNESLGIVQAKAYDAQGKLLKEFYPKDIKKVAGQWQVGSMEIYNVQTRSRTRLEFDLKAK